jgi:hypothetical protein
MGEVIDLAVYRKINNIMKEVATMDSEKLFGEVGDILMKQDMLRTLSEQEYNEVTEALRIAKEESNDGYAVTYINAVPAAFKEYGIEGYRVQLLYVLANLERWRGTTARKVRATIARTEEKIRKAQF